MMGDGHGRGGHLAGQAGKKAIARLPPRFFQR
jgi:hypothetical protein